MLGRFRVEELSMITASLAMLDANNRAVKDMPIIPMLGWSGVGKTTALKIIFDYFTRRQVKELKKTGALYTDGAHLPGLKLLEQALREGGLYTQQFFDQALQELLSINLGGGLQEGTALFRVHAILAQIQQIKQQLQLEEKGADAADDYGSQTSRANVASVDGRLFVDPPGFGDTGGDIAEIPNAIQRFCLFSSARVTSACMVVLKYIMFPQNPQNRQAVAHIRSLAVDLDSTYRGLVDTAPDRGCDAHYTQFNRRFVFVFSDPQGSREEIVQSVHRYRQYLLAQKQAYMDRGRCSIDKFAEQLRVLNAMDEDSIVLLTEGQGAEYSNPDEVEALLAKLDQCQETPVQHFTSTYSEDKKPQLREAMRFELDELRTLVADHKSLLERDARNKKELESLRKQYDEVTQFLRCKGVFDRVEERVCQQQVICQSLRSGEMQQIKQPPVEWRMPAAKVQEFRVPISLEVKKKYRQYEVAVIASCGEKQVVGKVEIKEEVLDGRFSFSGEAIFSFTAKQGDIFSYEVTFSLTPDYAAELAIEERALADLQGQKDRLEAELKGYHSCYGVQEPALRERIKGLNARCTVLEEDERGLRVQIAESVGSFQAPDRIASITVLRKVIQYILQSFEDADKVFAEFDRLGIPLREKPRPQQSRALLNRAATMTPQRAGERKSRSSRTPGSDGRPSCPPRLPGASPLGNDDPLARTHPQLPLRRSLTAAFDGDDDSRQYLPCGEGPRLRHSYPSGELGRVRYGLFTRENQAALEQFARAVRLGTGEIASAVAEQIAQLPQALSLESFSSWIEQVQAFREALEADGATETEDSSRERAIQLSVAEALQQLAQQGSGRLDQPMAPGDYYLQNRAAYEAFLATLGFNQTIVGTDVVSRFCRHPRQLDFNVWAEEYQREHEESSNAFLNTQLAQFALQELADDPTRCTKPIIGLAQARARSGAASSSGRPAAAAPPPASLAAQGGATSPPALRQGTPPPPPTARAPASSSREGSPALGLTRAGLLARDGQQVEDGEVHRDDDSAVAGMGRGSRTESVDSLASSGRRVVRPLGLGDDDMGLRASSLDRGGFDGAVPPAQGDDQDHQRGRSRHQQPTRTRARDDRSLAAVIAQAGDDSHPSTAFGSPAGSRSGSQETAVRHGGVSSAGMFRQQGSSRSASSEPAPPETGMATQTDEGAVAAALPS